jgi:exodeoxyribonuclease-3
MRITTWNVNGLRAAWKKGFSQHLGEIDPDVLMLQEIRVTPDQLTSDQRNPLGWHCDWHPAEKLGYAGTATWSKRPHERLSTGMIGADPHGRVLRSRVDDVEVINVYLPSGSRSPEAQAEKETFMAAFLPWSASLAASGHAVILAGDLNIAHTERDIHNAKSNAKSSGFLPHERSWFGALLQAGWTDLLRAHVGPAQGPYSWWSNRGQARVLDRGWRIDYLLGNAVAAERLTRAWIRKEANEVSDHAPVTIELSDR